MRSERGQASVDYVALTAVLGLALGAALGLATGGAAGVVNAVVGQLRHALCIVGGGPCSDPRARACTVASKRDAHHVAVNIALVRADHDRYVLRERMSDGTVRLTVGRSSAAGVEVGLGGAAKVAFRGRRIGVSDEARAGAQGVLGSGQVFVARDAREADAFMQAIGAGRAPAAAREVFVDGGVRGLGRIGVGSSAAGASLDGLSGAMIGARRDRRTGETTFVLGQAGSQWGALAVALGGPVALSDRATTLGLLVDRQRRARELSISSSGTLAGGATLPQPLARILGHRQDSASRATGRRWEISARLDLLDPAVAAAWARFRRDPASGAAVRAMGEAIAGRAQLDVRAYRAVSSTTGVGAGVSLGIRLGGELEHTIDDSTLLAAASRPPGGLWEPRVDCVA